MSEVVQKLKDLIEHVADSPLTLCKIEVSFQGGRPGIVRSSLDSVVPAGHVFPPIGKDALIASLEREITRAAKLDLFGSVGLIFTSNMGQLCGVRRVFETTAKLDTSRPVQPRR